MCKQRRGIYSLLPTVRLCRSPFSRTPDYVTFSWKDKHHNQEHPFLSFCWWVWHPMVWNVFLVSLEHSHPTPILLTEQGREQETENALMLWSTAQKYSKHCWVVSSGFSKDTTGVVLWKIVNSVLDRDSKIPCLNPYKIDGEWQFI